MVEVEELSSRLMTERGAVEWVDSKYRESKEWDDDRRGVSKEWV